MPKTLAERFKDWLKRQPDDPEAEKLAKFLDEDTDTEKEPTTVDFTQTPEWKALQAKLAEQDARLAKFSAETATKTAEQAVAKLKSKVTPAQRPALEALFTQLAKDDAADAQTVTFSIEGEADFTGSRVEAALAFFGGAGNIVLTAETLDDDSDAAKFAAGGKDAKDTGLNPYQVAQDYKDKQKGGK